MYLHLGKGRVVSEDEIIGIFDLDITSQSHLTRRYLALAEKAGQVMNVCDDLPKSFVVCQTAQGGQALYLSQLASSTLLKRAETISLE